MTTEIAAPANGPQRPRNAAFRRMRRRLRGAAALAAVLSAGTSACGELDEALNPGDDPGPVAVDAGVLDSGAPPPTPCAAPNEAEVIRLANEARQAQGAGPLACDPVLTAVARAHSRDMCDRNFFSHVNLAGEDPFDRMRAAGIAYRAAGENIAQGQPTADVVHTAWMNSAGHRRNILNRSFGRIGVGYAACGGARRHYWTQVFTN